LDAQKPETNKTKIYKKRGRHDRVALKKKKMEEGRRVRQLKEKENNLIPFPFFSFSFLKKKKRLIMSDRSPTGRHHSEETTINRDS
jgi:hypothetical protein